MKKKFKSVVSMALAIVILFSSAPLSGLTGLDLIGLFEFKAEAFDSVSVKTNNEPDALFETESVEIAESSIIDSGSFETFTWSLNSVGVLEISGIGAITGNYYSKDAEPWSAHKDKIKRIIFHEGITSIAPYMFYNYDSLISIDFPNTLKSIKHTAFEHCSLLQEVIIPDSVTSIGYHAFRNCEKISKVKLSNKLYELESEIFYNCDNLRELYIPATVKIYNYSSTNTPFRGSTGYIQKIVITAGTNGVMQDFGYDSSSTSVYFYYAPWRGNSPREIVIEEGVKTIGSKAFAAGQASYSDNPLTTLTLPGSLTTVKAGAFSGCTNIKTINYTGDLSSWCRKNFIGSIMCSALEYLYIDGNLIKNSLTIPENVNEISAYAFYRCDELTNIYIPIGTKTIEEYAFYMCSKISDVYYAGSEEEWAAISLSSTGNSCLTNATIHYNHTHNYIQNVIIPATCLSEGKSEMRCECGNVSEIIVTPITDCAPSEWIVAKEPTCFDDGISIKKCTFCDEELERMSIDATGHTDGEWKITTNPTTSAEGEKTLYCATCNEPIKTASVPMLDAACDYLEWKVNEDKTVTITDCDTSYSGEFSIPAAIYEYPVTGIGSSAFYNCDNITKITIPATVTSIKDEEYSTVGFHTCDNLESIVVDEANEKYSSENGVIYNKDKTKLISVPAKAIDGEFVMPSTVTTVSRYAFDAHNGIKLTLSDNLSSIDWSYINAKEFVASDNSENFATVDGVVFSKSKTTLYRFPIASDITEYDVPEGVRFIDKYAFYKSGIKKVSLPDTVISFSSMAFYNCEQLERVDYHCLDCWCCLQFEDDTGNPLSNGAALYVNDVLVDDLDVGEMHEEGIQLINAYAFYGYEHFRSLAIPSTVWKIGREAFFGCDNLKLLTVLGNVTEWGTGVFRSCPDLYTVQFAEGTTKIGAEAFWSCYSLQQLYIPSTMTYIGNGAFYGNSGQIDKVCYGGGSSSKWNNIDKSYNNTRLTNSTISYHKHTTSSSTKLVDVVNPTCTEAGYTGDIKNSSCLMYTSLGKVVPATGHKPGEWETKVEPGCVSEGTKVKKCTVCKEEVETDTIPVTGHDYKAVVTEPTCTEGGYTTNTCSKCSNFYRSDETEATGHKPGEWETKVEPGCESEGTKVKKCTVCKEEVETDTIPETGHDYKAVVTKPSCTVDGYTTHTCSVCKDSYTDSEVKAEGHKYDSVVTPNTCTKDGYTTHTCSVCEDTYTDSETKATGHSHESKVTKEPTCTNTGIRTFTCHCGDSYTEVIKANGHTKGEWEYIGGKEYAKSCTVCGDKLESKIVTVDMFFNGENVNKKQVLNKSTATVTATVTDNFVNDLVFASSDNSTVSVDANGNVVANNIGKATITVTIKGTAISDSIEVEVLPRDFTVTWNVNDKQTKHTVKEEAKFTPDVNTTLKGYKFIGWDKTVPTTMPAENLTFTAQYELIVKQLKIKNPSTSTINYGETLVMHADFGGVELPEGWKIQWTVEGAGFDMAPAADGLTCKMTSVANGNATVKATLVDENGEAVLDADTNEMSDSKQLTSKAGFWQKFVSFFKNLFGISRIILQSI